MNTVKTPKPLPNSRDPYARCSKATQRPYRLPGVVVRQYRKQGGKTFGPYFFRVWWEGGKQRKAYVRSVDLPDVWRACDRWAEYRALDKGARWWRDRQDDHADESKARREAEYARYPQTLADCLRLIDRVYGIEGAG